MKQWIFMSTITYFYTGSTEAAVEKQFADLRGISTGEEFVSYLKGVIETKFTDDYFNLTLPAALASAAAQSPAWYGYIAALVEYVRKGKAAADNLDVSEQLKNNKFPQTESTCKNADFRP